MTQRQPEDTVWHEHGFCACYSGKITCSTNESDPVTKSVAGGQCKLKLPKNSNMYNLALITSSTVFERQEFINEKITMTSSSINVDGKDISSVMRDEEDLQNFRIPYSDYKTMLLKLEPKTSRFINSPPATYIAW